jgi:uncharacterized membrane protein YidH (DUF202 family)
MTKKKYIGIVLCVLGITIAGVGSLWQASWNEVTLIAKSGPYASTVGFAGVVILIAGVYFLTWPLTSK